MRNALKLSCCLALVVFGFVVRAHAALPAIAIVTSENEGPTYITDTQNKLLATGLFSTVDVLDASTATPTVAQLRQYRSILVWSDSAFFDSAALGNNVDTYLRGGGGVVIQVFANADPGSLSLDGAWLTNGDSPMTVANQTQGTILTLGTVHVPTSPLMAGVTTFNGGSSSFNDPGTITAGAVDIADWSNGTPLVATKKIGSSLVVALNFWPPSSDVRADLWVATTDGTRLMSNALLAAGGPAAQVAPVPTLGEPALLMLELLLAAVTVLASAKLLATRRR